MHQGRTHQYSLFLSVGKTGRLDKGRLYGWDDGAQVLAPHDKGIIDEVNKIASAADIKFEGNKELIQIIGKDIDDEYLRQVHTISIDPEVIKRQKDLKIVYTPIHGTGMMLIPQSLKLWGFENVHCVPEQMVKSGDFPTVVSPNPENAEALTLAIKLAKEIDADIVMASDPDADRVGMACKDDKGEWVLINGNQTCLIFLYYIIKNRIAMGKMKGNEFIVKTIVTTELIKSVADKNNIKMLDCYTGFKWIAREIRLREGKEQYIGGGEESYGFLAEDFVRDKDAVSACSLLAEICAWAKDQGKTLYDVLMEIYVEYGFSKEVTVNVVKPGKSGADEIKAMMDNFRACPPKELGGSEVVLVKDYKTLKATDANGNVTDLDMPEPSNVLQFFTADGHHGRGGSTRGHAHPRRHHRHDGDGGSTRARRGHPHHGDGGGDDARVRPRPRGPRWQRDIMNRTGLHHL